MLGDPHSLATLARNRLVYQLRASDQKAVTKLAQALCACTAAVPCRSAACTVCGLRFQATAVAAVKKFVREPSHRLRDRMHAATIVPARRVVAPEELTVEAFSAVALDIAAAYARVGLPPTIFGLEVSLNEDANGEVETHWAPHGHGIGLDWLSPDQDRALREAFPSSLIVKRPVHVELLDGDPRGLRYPFKAERYRRVTQPITTTGDQSRRPPPKRRPLRPWQATALALVEHEVGFRGRLLTHGIDTEAFNRALDAAGWPRDGP